jgi:hypothetical protein
MPAKTYINDNGTWRTVRSIYVNDGTAWRTVKAQWVNDNGTWRLVHRGVFVYNETISTDQANYNLRTKLTAAGWDGSQDVEATITVNPGVTIYATTTPVAAFTIDPALPPQSTVSLTNQGSIIGKGGAGGNGGGYIAGTPYEVPNPKEPESPITINPLELIEPTPGFAGGVGIRTASQITLNNTGGTIAGGGGGGGAGGYAVAWSNQSSEPPANWIYADIALQIGGTGGGGGGGSSLSGSSGGSLGPVTGLQQNPGYLLRYDGFGGNAGTNVAGASTSGRGPIGPSPLGGTGYFVSGKAGNSGPGGGRGSAGGVGSQGTASAVSTGPNPGQPTIVTPSGGGAGAAGLAISGNPLVTLPAPQTGTINGSRS